MVSEPLYGDLTTVEPPNNGQVGDEHFVHYSEVVPSSEVPLLSTLKLISHFKNGIALHTGCQQHVMEYRIGGVWFAFVC